MLALAFTVRIAMNGDFSRGAVANDGRRRKRTPALVAILMRGFDFSRGLFRHHLTVHLPKTDDAKTKRHAIPIATAK